VCGLEFSDLQASFVDAYPGLTILGVDTGFLGDTVATAERFIEQNGLEFEIVFDEGSFELYAWDFGLAPYPRQALLDGDGVIRYMNSEHDPAALSSALDSLLP
jgi:hypothetical protein